MESAMRQSTSKLINASQEFPRLPSLLAIFFAMLHPLFGEKPLTPYPHPMAGTFTAGTTDLGSIIYPNGGMWPLDQWPIGLEASASVVVGDASLQSVLVGCFTAPSQIVKINTSIWDMPMERGGAILLAAGENNVNCAVYDPLTQCALFGTNTTPGRIIKVAMGSGARPVRIGAVTLSAGENSLRCAAIDSTGQYAWFGTSTSPGKIIKIRIGGASEAPQRLGALTLDTGENLLSSAIRLPDGVHLLFGTATSPGRIVKVARGVGDALPTRVTALTLNTGENSPGAAVMDVPADQVLYSAGTKLIKIDPAAGTNPPIRLNATDLIPGGVTGAAFDPSSGTTLWTGSAGKLFKFLTQSAANPPLLISDLILDWPYAIQSRGVVPLDGDRAFVTHVTHGTKIAIGGPMFAINQINDLVYRSASPYGLGWTVFNSSLNLLATLGGYSWSDKFFMGEPGDEPIYVGESGPYADPSSVVLDQSRNHIWAGNITSDFLFPFVTTVYSVTPGDLTNPPAFIGTASVGFHRTNYMLALDETEDYGLAWGPYSPGDGLFNPDTDPARLYKFGLGNELTQPEMMSFHNVGNTAWIESCLLDTANDYAYLGLNSSSFRGIRKRKIEPGTQGIRSTGELSFASEQGAPAQIEGDFSRSLALVFSQPYAAPGIPRIISISLSPNDNAPTKLTEFVLDDADDASVAIIIDPSAAIAWVATTEPSKIIKLKYGSGATPMIKLGELTREPELFEFFADLQKGWGTALGNYDEPGATVSFMDQFSLGAKGLLKGTKCVMTERGEIEDFHFFSHSPNGKVRLSIYDDSTPRRRLWNSGWITNLADSAELIVPVSQGWPTSLIINAGNYWLCWEVDTNSHVASHVNGITGDGFTARTYNALLPLTLSDSQLTQTAEKWTLYLTYGMLSNEVRDWAVFQ